MAAGEILGNGNTDGTSVGASTTEKISFYGVDPVAQQTVTTAGTDIATVILELTDLRLKLKNLGLIA